MIPIVVPTHGRAGEVLALKPFPSATLCVAESQKDAYAAEYPDAPLLVHPDSVVGLAPKRQWIYEQLGDVFMVDDDVGSVIDMTRVHGETSVMDDALPEQIVQRAAEQCRDMGAYLFGFSQYPDPAMYKPQDPFRLKGYIGGHAMGILGGSKLYWHPESDPVEDYWVCLLNAYYHRTAFIDRRYHFTQAETGKRVGGLAYVRSADKQEKAYKFLREHFGDAVRMKTGMFVVTKGGGPRKFREEPPHRPSMKLPF